MNWKEIITGGPGERAAWQTIRQLGNRSHLNPSQQVRLQEARGISRRLFLRQAAMAGSALLVASGVALPVYSSVAGSESLRVRQPFKGSQYENWQRYFNDYLPNNFTLAIADDLINAPEYAGFPEAGRLLRTAVSDFEALSQINPPLSAPVRVALKNLVGHGVLSRLLLASTGIGVETKIINRMTGQSFTLALIDPKKHTLELELEQTVVYAPNAVKALLIAKEISH